MRQQIQAADATGSKVLVIIGPDEIKEGKVKIREILPKGASREPIEKLISKGDVLSEARILLSQ